MATTYPYCISDSEICQVCYTGQSCKTCGNGNYSGGVACVLCDVGCNTSCDASQAYCSISVENINSHADVPTIVQPATCFGQGEIISKAWTADYWNKIIDKLETAGKLGQEQPHGDPPPATKAAKDTNLGNATSHPQNSLITAEKYNQLVKMMNHFNQTLSTVKKDEVIKAAHAQALVKGAKNARFNTNVCDVCNAGGENRNACPCDCSCACGCTCPCSCFCPNPIASFSVKPKAEEAI